ncbi:MAG: N-acetylmuramoyl-L-alanine amidase [bacterium]
MRTHVGAIARITLFTCLSFGMAVSKPAERTKSVQVQHTAKQFVQGRFSADLRVHGPALQLAPQAASSSFVSADIANDFPFNAIGPHWLATLPAGTGLVFSVRASADGRHWGEWVIVPEDEDLAAPEDKGQPAHVFVGDRMGALVFVAANSRFVQYKIDLQGNLNSSPRVERVALQLINSLDGPAFNESQNKLAPSTRQTQQAAVPKPGLFKRAEWGARPPARGYTYILAKHLVFHHTAGIADYNVRDWNDCAARVRAIQAYHMDSQGWDDIGYNYLICRHGSIVQGREDDNDATDIQGAHACAKNSGTMGVSMLGYFHRDNVKPQADLPTPEMLSALQLLLAWKCDERNIDPKGRSFYAAHGAVADHILGHRDVCSTSCPGDSLFVYKPSIRDAVAKIIADFTTAVSERSGEMPETFTLLPAYPNPFALSQRAASSAINLPFDLPIGQELHVTIHNIAGQMVHEWPARAWATGLHKIVWDGKSMEGHEVPAGVYFVRMAGKTQMQQSKILLIK